MSYKNPVAGATSKNYASAYDTTTQAVTTGGTFQDVTFDTNVQLNGWTHTAGTANFTCPVTGLYLVEYAASVSKNANPDQTVEIVVVNNGAQVAGSASGSVVTTTNERKRVSNAVLVNITAGHVLKLQWTSTTTGVGQIRPNILVATVSPSITITITRLS